MDLATQLDPWWRFGAALLIGALVGLEREYIQQRQGDPEFARIRTFSLMALFGAVAAYVAREQGVGLFIVAFASLALLITVSLLGDLYHQGHGEGITTEIVALIMPLLGALVIYDRAELAVALGVVVALVLALKPVLHGLASRMSSVDLRATLEFALITAVVWPMLPDVDLGPFGVFNPRDIWLMVILVSGLGFLGYVLMKVLGAERGIGLTGALGGLVSSTAVTASFSSRSREAPGLATTFALAIALASCVLYPRVLVEVTAVHSPLIPLVAPTLGAMLLTGLVGAFWLWRSQRQQSERADRVVTLQNPLRLSTAITFGLMFAFVIFLVSGAEQLFGEAGVYATSLITGLVDVDAITLSSANLAAEGRVGTHVAAGAIVLASIVNTLSKGVLAISLGSVELRRPILTVFGSMALAGALVAALTLLPR
jgi:uncharacterized membrane protein (DUF4010 family)